MFSLDIELTHEGPIPKWRRWTGLVVCVVLFSVVIAFAAGKFRTFRVTSGSMEPTLLTGDVILVDAVGPVTPKAGEIVAVKNPKDESEWLCKRVVAVPGDVIGFRNGYFVLNGEVQDAEPYVAAHRMEGLPEVGPMPLGKNQYFVMGDNRGRSYDSLDFGPVPREDFIGVAVAVYWPWGRRKWLEPREAPEASADADATKTASEGL